MGIKDFCFSVNTQEKRGEHSPQDNLIYQDETLLCYEDDPNSRCVNRQRL